MANKPLVTVVLPTFNRAHVLNCAIDSALNQTYTNFELFVVDDGSNDDTCSVVNSYSDERICYEYQNNQGANVARNRGIKNSNGEIISFLDSDDEYLPNRLSRCVEIFNETEAAGVFHSYLGVKNGDELYQRDAPRGYISLKDAKQRNPIGSFSATMFHKSVFDTVGYLDEEMPAKQDYEFYIRVLKQFDLFGIDEVLMHHHRLPDSIGTSPTSHEEAYKMILNRHGDILGDGFKARSTYSLGMKYASNAELSPARVWFKKSIRLNPFRLKAYLRYLATFCGKQGYDLIDRIGARV